MKNELPGAGRMSVPRVTRIHLTLLIGIALYAVPTSLGAAEQTSEHRIFGLFSPDRVSDLHKAMDDLPELHLVQLDFDTARITLRYDLNVLFPKLNPSKPPSDAEIEQRLSGLIDDASNNTFWLKPSSKISKEKLAKLEIRIGLLDCRGCRYGVHLMLMDEPGVEQVTVVGNLVTVWIDPASTSQAAIAAVLGKNRVAVLEKK